MSGFGKEQEIIHRQLSEKSIAVLPPDRAIEHIEASPASTAQQHLMRAIIEQGKTFWHDFGNGAVCILDVARFFNQAVDIPLMQEVAKETAKRIGSTDATVALTAASSGNIFTFALCRELGIPRLIYAAKQANVIHLDSGVIQMEGTSYTGGNHIQLAVGRSLLTPDDRVLVVDDFLDTGKMSESLIDISRTAGARVAGFAFAISKRYAGGERVIHSLTRQQQLSPDRFVSFLTIEHMAEGIVHFSGMPSAFQLKRNDGETIPPT